MKYVVFTQDYEDFQLFAVFDDEETAQAWVAEYNANEDIADHAAYEAVSDAAERPPGYTRYSVKVTRDMQATVIVVRKTHAHHPIREYQRIATNKRAETFMHYEVHVYADTERQAVAAAIAHAGELYAQIDADKQKARYEFVVTQGTDTKTGEARDLWRVYARNKETHSDAAFVFGVTRIDALTRAIAFLSNPEHDPAYDTDDPTQVCVSRDYRVFQNAPLLAELRAALAE